ncbi:MAG: aminotransferase class IV, partial [Haloechinothrix sp.]
MRVLVFLDGSIADPDVPHIRVDDLGLMRGDGVFETVLVVDGRARELTPHLERLERSAAMLDLPVPDRASWELVFQRVIENWSGSREMALKLVYTRGVEGVEGSPTGFALGFEIDAKILRAREEGIAVITLD